MNRAAWIAWSKRLSWVSGSAVAILSLWLIADGVLERGRAATEAARVEALEARVLTEAAAAEELAAETERQTQRSVEREQRNTRLGWGLLIATTLFLISAKGHQELHESRQPELISIGAGARSRSASLATSRSRTSPPITPPQEVDLEFVDSVIDTTGGSRESAIPILQALQSHFRYLPKAALQRVCERSEIDPAQIIGVASFYSQFRRDPVGRNLVRVCHGTACHVAGIEHIMDELRRRLEVPPDADTDPCRRFTLESVNCLGCCSLAPVMMIEDHVAGHLSPTNAWEELEAAEADA